MFSGDIKRDQWHEMAQGMSPSFRNNVHLRQFLTFDFVLKCMKSDRRQKALEISFDLNEL